ncbi:HAD family hydrolase [Halothermothrix orenii]|uniref:HAD-superfamily hydrolase, subfamily IA, variant 1 n=1 Tax=Halothermothrix orenii (strain H 168 / OCM 544 / DSM 9562) TaxID=373903 RepID=B8D033_HALOH|nr:HAD family hydrolase [Halothermothrix orenii]ACL68787.1 HAD-superfamily hydrolase, subfamily IA, variant 1 [Halothermothrix orenii H 168]
MIKAIIFDIDDTLISHTSAIKKGSKNFYDKFIAEKGFTLSEFQDIWKEEHDKYMEQYLKKEITFQEQKILRLKGVFSRFGENISSAEAKEFFNYYLSAYENNWTLFSDVCLELLNDYLLGIISDGDSDQQRKKLKNKSIIDFFDTVVISGDLGISKPDKRIFKKCLNDLDINSYEALYIGDNYKKDFIGAINSVLYAGLIDRNADKKIEYVGNGFIINSLELIPEIIKEINKNKDVG